MQRFGKQRIMRRGRTGIHFRDFDGPFYHKARLVFHPACLMASLLVAVVTEFEGQGDVGVHAVVH